MARALSANELSNKKYQLFDFKGDWMEAFGNPEMSGVWFIWGNSGSGKTTFTLQLVKYLSQFDKVLYNSLEEATSYTMKLAFGRVNMQEVGTHVQLLAAEPIKELINRLDKRQSRRIVVIDSIQYARLNYPKYQDFVERYPNKLFIFTSQAKGMNPVSRTAEQVMFDADLKIWVEGHKAFSKGRYIGTSGEYTIWDEGAEKYWGRLENQ
ncbi:hypothetical protein ETU09_00640 [Apibacter muscae]|uniref:AAA+ ATPase domain-containing protein n=1 Tax=Apibacter muscae TaxID=2509004 RepID=A0A563DKR5_9FLAO|nr:hypothetical protein [Apibacter muscae]TWP30541.1 hypothetical protein ETU09_00640 [Apibacter muscae]